MSEDKVNPLIEPTADKASRLFKYLSTLQAMKEHKVFNFKEYAREGAVFHINQLLALADQSGRIFFGPTVDISALESRHRLPDNEQNRDVLVSFKKSSAPVFPQFDENIIRWIDGDVKTPESSLEIARQIEVEGEELLWEEQSLLFQDSVRDWLNQWNNWSRDSKYAVTYQKIFELQTKVNQQSEDFELVLGLGAFTWKHSELRDIERQLFTAPLQILLDKLTGDVEIRLSESELRAELDAIPTEQLIDSTFTVDVKAAMEHIEGDLLNEATFADLGKVLANGFGEIVEYRGDWSRQNPMDTPVVSWSPAIIIRKRQQPGLAKAFDEISRSIEASRHVPRGLATLLDPNNQYAVETISQPGAIEFVGEEVFTPLPLNRRQEEVLRRVDSHAQTIVQGPPGTGKTHMAAALISHLLAQGKRILVTAHAERALYEVKDKLPVEIRDLAVSVIGSDRSDMSDLKVAVDTIARRSSDFDEVDSANDEKEILEKIETLKSQRLQKIQEWSAVMEAEQEKVGIPGYEAQMSEVVQKWLENHDRFSWISDLHVVDPNLEFPLTSDELELWFKHVLNPDLNISGLKTEIAGFEITAMPTVNALSTFAAYRDQTEQRLRLLKANIGEQHLLVWRRLSDEVKVVVESMARQSTIVIESLQNSNYRWAEVLLADFDASKMNQWVLWIRHRSELLREVEVLSVKCGALQHIEIKGEPETFLPQARNIADYLRGGGVIRTRADGLPKIGFMTKQVVKDCQGFFESVRVNGLPPTQLESVDLFIDYVHLGWVLDKMAHEWPFDKPQLTLLKTEQFSYWRQSVGNLERAIGDLSKALQVVDQLQSLGFRIVPRELVDFGMMIGSAKEVEQLESELSATENPFQTGVNYVESVENSTTIPQWLCDLKASLNDRNLEAYKSAYEEARRIIDLAESHLEYKKLTRKLDIWSPDLSEVIRTEGLTDSWKDRLRAAEDARMWALAGDVIAARLTIDLSKISEEIRKIDDRLNSAIASLAAVRAWAKAVNGERLDAKMRSNLIAYSQSVTRLGKGTGVHADRKRRDVRRHLMKCRSAVPVWIMPLYRVVEQFELEENIFDVIIVDEASQAGVEAIFLQYLAPRIVVIGDDKQVSPTPFENEDEIQKVARQYLYDFENIDAWTNPSRSLFDDANMRYGGRITLEEHRRCVPEIIGFSNKYIYEPENIRLKPVRKVSGKRLAPFRITQTPRGYFAENSRLKVNTVEADVLVDRLIQALHDPEYDGKTFGVISLLSTSNQAKYIQARLLERVPTEAWAERDLKIGPPAEFQGAERDVIFLSMVQPSSERRRVGALTTDKHLQRYNVAVSRARDQVWIFHSIGVEELNPTDIRFKLLDYAYSVAEGAPELEASARVPEDDRVEPFDSLFEQRVYNRIVERGYRVTPQYDAFGYRIDLVVEGPDDKLAIECDGDYWHSGANFERDQIRQRELERLGWRFVRIFESDFYLDPDAQIAKVLAMLDELGIHAYEYKSNAETSHSNIEVITSLKELVPQDVATVDDTEAYDHFYSRQNALSNVKLVDEPVFETSSEVFLTRSDDEEHGAFVGDYSYEIYENHKLISNESSDYGYKTANTPEYWTMDTVADAPRAEDSIESVADNRSASFSEYVSFIGATVPVHEATPREIKDGLRAIVAVEGPIRGDYLAERYVISSGGQRVTRAVRQKLVQQINALVREQKIFVIGGQHRKNFDSTDYSSVESTDTHLRTLGPREVYQLPSVELYALVKWISETTGCREPEELKRQVQLRLKFGKLTSKLSSFLDEPIAQLLSEGKEGT
ncbi:AAA domain-containing protein [Staphylococcus chromogenes]|nr:AAA domain-containing protein [Staphylococcus chromogenes]